MSDLGYVVVEFNQASGQPAIADQDIHRTEEEAEESRDRFRAQTAAAGRRERHVVALLYVDEDTLEESR